RTRSAQPYRHLSFRLPALVLVRCGALLGDETLVPCQAGPVGAIDRREPAALATIVAHDGAIDRSDLHGHVGDLAGACAPGGGPLPPDFPGRDSDRSAFGLAHIDCVGHRFSSAVVGCTVRSARPAIRLADPMVPGRLRPPGEHERPLAGQPLVPGRYS